MKVFVREAMPADDVAVGELLVRAFVDSYRRKMPEVVIGDQRKAELRDVAGKRAEARVWVAEVDGRVVGTVALWPPGAAGSEAWLPNAADLRHLAIEASARGGNVSGALLDATEAWARGAGCQAICLHVRRGATGVAAVYLRRGYRWEPQGNLDRLPDVFLEAMVLPLAQR